MSNTFLTFTNNQVSQVLARISGHISLYVSIGHLEEARNAHQLTRAMNKIQSSLWKLTADARLLASQRVTAVLSQCVLKAPDASLRVQVADWLRFLVQTGVVAQPQTVFATLVTAALHAAQGDSQQSAYELSTYLHLILASFWPFRAPCAAYPRELFPSHVVFYPLIPLLDQADTDMQELLHIIFTELSTPDEC